MAATENETLGFAIMILELLKHEKEQFKKGGLDAEMMIARLETLVEKLAEIGQKQEDLKRETMEMTSRLRDVQRETYTTTSGYLDMMIGAVKKNSHFAKNIKLIRSRINRPRKEKEQDALQAIQAEATIPPETEPQTQS